MPCSKLNEYVGNMKGWYLRYSTCVCYVESAVDLTHFFCSKASDGIAATL